MGRQFTNLGFDASRRGEWSSTSSLRELLPLLLLCAALALCLVACTSVPRASTIATTSTNITSLNAP